MTLAESAIAEKVARIAIEQTLAFVGGILKTSFDVDPDIMKGFIDEVLKKAQE
jgi:hypothetical protein